MNRNTGILAFSFGMGLLALVIVLRHEPEDVLAEACELGAVVSEECQPTVELSPGQFGPLPVASGDVNADGNVNITDAVSLLNFLFLGGPEPLPLVCVRCESGPKACIRFTNDLFCGGTSFAPTLTVCGTQTIAASTGIWSGCICVEPGDCQLCLSSADVGCGPLDFCGTVTLEAGTVYAAVLLLDDLDSVTVSLLEEAGDCSNSPPDLGIVGAGVQAGEGAAAGVRQSFSAERTAEGYTRR